MHIVAPCIYSDGRFTDQCVVPVLARGTTTTTDEDGVRQLMPPFVHAMIV
jgi:hypothetical protein